MFCAAEASLASAPYSADEGQGDRMEWSISLRIDLEPEGDGVRSRNELLLLSIDEGGKREL